MKNPFAALILVGGADRGFKSRTPRALHSLLGKPMASLILEAVAKLRPRRIGAVVGSWAEEFTDFFSETGIEIIREKNAPGTGRPTLSLARYLKIYGDGDVLIIQANLPLITAFSLKALLARHRKSGDLGTALVAPGVPSGRPSAERLCSSCLFKTRELLRVLPKIQRGDKGALPLNDIVSSLSMIGKIGVCRARGAEELFEVGSRYDLALAAAALRLRKIRELSRQGVTVLDPFSTWIDLDVRIGPETVIYPSVIIEGNSRIGNDCRIYPHSHLLKVRIGDRVRVYGSTIVEDGVVENDAQVGPFSRLRPGAVIKSGARVGNFVEMKNTIFGPRSKAMHLSYLGDSAVGEGVNIGAGTITCNYDGINKNRTTIEDGAFIGSGTELVAPVKIGKKAYVAAGSTITLDVGPGALAIGRARQIEKPGWVGKQAARRGKQKPKNPER